MRSVILYGATHLLFAAALAIDPAINLLRVHEHIEYNRHVMDDVPNAQPLQPTPCAINAGATSLMLVPTADNQITTAAACGAPPSEITLYELVDEDDSDGEDEYIDTTVWQTVTATQTDTFDDGGSCPTPAITDVPPSSPYCQSPTPSPPPSPPICSPPPSPPASSPPPSPPCPPSPPVCSDPPPPPPPCTTTTPVSYVTVTAQPDGSCPSPDPAPAPAPDCDEGDDEEVDDSCPSPAPPSPPPPPPPTCPSNEFEHQYGDDAVDYIIDTKDHVRNRVECAKERTARELSHFSPKHIHERVSQVLHDRRPVNSLDHVRLHENHGRGPVQERRAKARRDRRNRSAAYTRDKSTRRVSYERSGYVPVRRPGRVNRDRYYQQPRRENVPTARAPVRERARDPPRRQHVVHDDASGCGCSTPVARPKAPIRDTVPCGCNAPVARPKAPVRDAVPCGCNTPVARPRAPVRDTVPCGCNAPVARAKAPLRDAVPCGCDTPVARPKAPVRDAVPCGCNAPVARPRAPVRDTAPCDAPAARVARVRAPIRDATPACGCGAPKPVVFDEYGCPQQKATCCGGEFEHQFGDDTMDFLLDTKDHTRNFLGRVAGRGKKALSHFAPSHLHDRTDQFVHDERPARSEDHMELHENHGYLS